MKNLAIGLWVAQTIAAIAMLIAATIEIESILVTGPILAGVGLLLALDTKAIQSRSTLTFALSGPLVAALISFLIAAFDLGPREADTPTVAVLIVYLALIWPVAIMSFLRILRWKTIATSPNRRDLQFSLKTLLIVTTAICILTAAGKLLVVASDGEAYLFGGFTLLVVVLIGLVVWRYLAYSFRGRSVDSSS